VAGVILFYASHISCCNSEKIVKIVYIYGSYHKIKTEVLLSLFDPPCKYNLHSAINTDKT